MGRRNRSTVLSAVLYCVKICLSHARKYKDYSCGRTNCYRSLYAYKKEEATKLTYLLTPCSRVLLEKLTGSAASQEIPRTLWNPKQQNTD